MSLGTASVETVHECPGRKGEGQARRCKGYNEDGEVNETPDGTKSPPFVPAGVACCFRWE